MGNRGVVGGLLVILWIICSAAVVVAQTGLLYLDGEPVSLDVPIVSDGPTTWVPLVSFAMRVGLDVALGAEDVVVRSAGSRHAYDCEAFQRIDGITYAPLDWLLEWIDGECHRVGGNTYLETTQARLTEVEASSEDVTLRLSRFSAHTEVRTNGALSDTVVLTWPNCVLDDGAQRIRLGESHIQDVRVVATKQGVSVSIQLEAGTQLSIKTSETGASFVAHFSVSDEASSEAVIELSDVMSVCERHTEKDDLTVNYLYVESWRDDYRVVPMVAESGYQSSISLESLLLDHGAIAAAALDLDADDAACLIMDGVPYAVPEVPTRVVAFDLFGRWTTFSSSCVVTVKHAGRMIDIDGVNRPMAYGDVIAYAPGYGGSIARGIPGTFLAVKIRENRVVSVYEGPFVPSDPSAIVVVASGDAKARLSLIELGDPIEVICTFAQVDGTYPHAVTCGRPVKVDGRAVAEIGAEARAESAAGTVLACDWQGGLYLLTFSGPSTGVGETTWNLLDVLATLPTVVKDALLLASSSSPSLAYVTERGAFTLGDRAAIDLGLGLVPIAP